MTPLNITPDIERAPWTDVPEDAARGRLTRIGLVRDATSEGRAAALVLVTLDDGTKVVAQTTWRLLHTAVRALKAGPVGSEEGE